MPRNQVIYYSPFLELYALLRFLFREHHLRYKVSVIKEIQATEKYLALKQCSRPYAQNPSFWSQSEAAGRLQHKNVENYIFQETKLWVSCVSLHCHC